MKLNIIYKYHSLLLIDLIIIALDVLNEKLGQLSLDDLIVLHLILIAKPLRYLISLQILLNLH
jgi:membrane protein YqaA with SNARE-associated domain